MLSLPTAATPATPAAELAARWDLGQSYQGVVSTETVIACRWQHSLPELPSVVVPSNTLFYRYKPTRAIRVNGKRVEASVHEKHGIGLIGEGEDGRWTYQDSVDILHIYISNQTLQRIATAEGGASQISLCPRLHLTDRVLQALVQEVGQLHADRECLGLYGDTLTLAIGMRLLREHSTQRKAFASSGPAAVRGGLSPWQLTQTIDCLRSRLSEDVSLQSLASAAKLSPYHFARAFKVSTGLPPHRYQTQLRIHRAQELLQSTTLSILEVAAYVGYQDPGHFAKVFRRVLGTTPAEFRRAHRR